MSVYRLSACLTCGEWGEAMGTGSELQPLRTKHTTDDGQIVPLYYGDSVSVYTSLRNYIAKAKSQTIIDFATRHTNIQLTIKGEV